MENHEKGVKSRKRKHYVLDKVSKRLCMDIYNEDSKFLSGLQGGPEHEHLHNAYQTIRCIPHQLIKLMYQLDLSVLCSLREFMYRQKYPSLSLKFDDTEIDKFSNIVLRYKDKSIYIQIENVDKYYIHNSINYARLFTKEKEKRSFFINNYFDSFVKHLISKSNSLSSNIEYLIIYTNSGLDLTEEKKLKQGRSLSFYPFRFDRINLKKCDILKDFLFTNNNQERHVLYKFSQEETTKEELLKRLEFSSAVQKVINARQFSQESQKEIKEFFLDKLVFAVNQPNREELNCIVKSEIKDSKVQDNYIALQERILCYLTAPEKLGRSIIYELNLLISFLHDMFLHKNMFFINSKEKRCDKSNNIIINRKDRITYVKVYNAGSNISYSHLFPSRTQERKNKFSINKHFALFVEELEKNRNVNFFIIYTNTGLDLTEEMKLKKERSKDFHPLKLDIIDIQQKKYKILRDCSCINKNGLYQFSQEETTRISSLLKNPPSLQREKEERLSEEIEKEIKENFLDKLIFAVNQPNREELNSIIKNEIENNSVPYIYEELYEIALRWSESHEFGPITKEIMEKLLGDIKNNRSSYQAIKNKNLGEKIKFAKSVVGREGTPTFNQFLDFLVKGEGIKYLDVLKENGINLPNMSSILNRAGYNAAKAFKNLYDLWFDAKGNKTQYLKTLEDEGVNLPNMSSILNGAGNNAARAFKDLYDLWFDVEGNKTQYLKSLENEGVNLPNMSSILNGAGNNAAKAFKDLYDLWFDVEGNKTQYLKTLEDGGVNLPNMSGILHGAGNSAAKAFKDLYNMWFDAKRNKTQYLKTLEDEGVNIPNMSSILSGAGANATIAFKDLYDLWFDATGNKTQYLKTLENEGVNLPNMSGILSKAGVNAAKTFKGLYDLWFNTEGKKTQYLKTLEEEGMTPTNISSILHGAAANAPKAFKDLYDLWFDKEGHKTQYLKTLEVEEVHLTNISSILNGAGANAVKAFKDLYDIWFDKHGNKKQHLNHFIRGKSDEKCFTLHNLSGILSGAGANAKQAFEQLHSVCFNGKGKRTVLLVDFYNADFEPSNLSSILCAAGSRASLILKRFHSVCFNDEGKRTHLLADFLNVGFRPGDLCSILSGAADSLQKFHDFCFTGETKKYLSHFINEVKGLTLSNLSRILHGARANIFSALKDFYDVCYDESGNKTSFLDDFYKVGFEPRNLSDVLCMAGNNAASILQKFHTLCFNKENYLNHFLAEKELFTPKKLSRILHRAGINICPVFEKLHDLCFDTVGHKTNFLNNLIENNQSNIPDILREEVKKSSVSLNKKNISEVKGDKTTNACLKLNNLSAITKQKLNLDSVGQASLRKKKGTTSQIKNRQEDKIVNTATGRI